MLQKDFRSSSLPVPGSSSWCGSAAIGSAALALSEKDVELYFATMQAISATVLAS